MEITLVAAMSINRVIGSGGKLPWHIPEELKIFKEVTLGHPMIMGRKTFDSLPGLLPGRQHVVLSRDPEYAPEGAIHAISMEDALDFCVGEERVSIIGGAQVFKEGLKFATKIRLTVINKNMSGDVFFPSISPTDFDIISRQTFNDASTPFVITTYIRI